MRLSRMNQSISQVFVVEAKLFPGPRVAPVLLYILWSTKYSRWQQENPVHCSKCVCVSKNFKNIMSITTATWMCSNSQWRPGIFDKFTWKRLRKVKGFHKTPYNQKIWILVSYCSILKCMSEWECQNLKRCCCHLSLSDKWSSAYSRFHLLKTDIWREEKSGLQTLSSSWKKSQHTLKDNSVSSLKRNKI